MENKQTRGTEFILRRTKEVAAETLALQRDSGGQADREVFNGAAELTLN